MKKGLLLITIALMACLCFVACQSSSQSAETEIVDVQQENDEATTQEEPTEDPQIVLDNEKVIEYLGLLGLSETNSYELLDTFPVNENEKSYLLNIYDIAEDDFVLIQDTLAGNGFALVSDVMNDEERKTRSYQYSNSQSVYTEIVFSYDAQYINIIFTPIV